MSGVECPTCGEDKFDTEKGMKIHHANSHGESIAKNTSFCEICNKEFEYYPANRKGKYCYSCTEKGEHHRDNTNKITVRCSWCDEEKEIYPSDKRESGTYYCNSKCRGKHQSDIWEGEVIEQDSKSVNCAYCKADIDVPKSRFHSQNKFFCDNGCHNDWRKLKRYTVFCEYCGKEKTVTEKNYRDDKNFFCSNSCRGKYKTQKGRKKVICSNKNCSESMERMKSIVNSYEVLFCSKSCQDEWAGSKQNPRYNGVRDSKGYGKGWTEARRQALERDSYMCQICERGIEDLGREPDVHHITPIEWFKNKDGYTKTDAHYLGNLVTLCNVHHSKYEYFTDELQETLPTSVEEKLDFDSPAHSGV